MLIIGLCGKMGSGKDFIGKNAIFKYLKKNYPHLNISFFSIADPLKMQVLEQYDLRWEDVYPPDGVSKTEMVRKILQTHGNLKRETRPDYWIRCYDYWCDLFRKNGCDVLITPDVRFKIEREHILKTGGIVCKVHAPSRTYQTQDSSLTKDVSEKDLDSLSDHSYFYVFENDLPLETTLNQYVDFFNRLDSILQ
jgi:hypothetical protein